MRFRSWPRVALWVFALLLLGAGTAMAQGDAKERARKLYEEATQHYELGEFERALELFKSAYRETQLPGFLFNIGQCHRKLGQYQKAIQIYESYLVKVPDASNKGVVEALIEESKARLKEIEAERARREAADRAEEQARLQAEREKAAAAARAAAAEKERLRLEARYDQHPVRPWTYVGAPVGLAAAGVGVAFAVRARNAQSEFDDLGCGDSSVALGPEEAEKCGRVKSNGDRDALLANVLLGSGAVIVAGSVLLYVLDPGNIERPEESPLGRVRVSPSSIGYAWSW